MWLLMRLLIFGLKNKSNIFYLIFGVDKQIYVWRINSWTNPRFPIDMYDMTRFETGKTLNGAYGIGTFAWKKPEFTVRSWIFRKLFAKHGLPIRQRIAQPLSIQIEKGVLRGEKLENDLQRILKKLKNYDSILLAYPRYPAIEN